MFLPRFKCGIVGDSEGCVISRFCLCIVAAGYLGSFFKDMVYFSAEESFLGKGSFSLAR